MSAFQEGNGDMRIVAVRGGRDFLVRTNGENGRVVDSVTGQVFREFPVQSILARAYWDDPDPSDPEQRQAMERVRAIMADRDARGGGERDAPPESRVRRGVA